MNQYMYKSKGQKAWWRNTMVVLVYKRSTHAVHVQTQLIWLASWIRFEAVHGTEMISKLDTLDPWITLSHIVMRCCVFLAKLIPDCNNVCHLCFFFFFFVLCNRHAKDHVRLYFSFLKQIFHGPKLLHLYA